MIDPKKLFMLCESCQDQEELKSFDRNRFKSNIKYDGERVIAIKQKGSSVILLNRGGNIVSYKFKEVVDQLNKIDRSFIVDGEIISHDNDFSKLQKRALTKDPKKIEALMKIIPVKYMVFDILSIDDRSIMNETLESRLVYLSQLIMDSEYVEMVEYDDIDNLLSIAIENQLEGIVIKDLKGVYEGRRSKNWIKHKLFKETTITITGFTENNAGIRGTDNEGNAVQIAGKNAVDVKEVMSMNGYVNINVQYLSKGKDGRMRFPSYRGIAE